MASIDEYKTAITIINEGVPVDASIEVITLEEVEVIVTITDKDIRPEDGIK